MTLSFYITFAGPCVSNIPLPAREEIWLGEDGSLSSGISGSDTESLVSEQSSDALTTDCEAGSCNDDQEEEMDIDNDSDSEASDGYEVIQTEHNIVKNPSWPEANQLA